MQAATKNNLAAAKRQELMALDEAIAERKKYYKEQRALIEEMVESGNTELMGLNHDILLARQELKGLKTDIRTSRQDKRLIEEDLEVIRVQIAEYHEPGLSIGVMQVTKATA